jgi:hypothetical protein
MLYATTRRFLEVFGLESLKNLPSLRELNDMAEQEGVAPAQSQQGEVADEAVTASDAEADAVAGADVVDGSGIDSADSDPPVAEGVPGESLQQTGEAEVDAPEPDRR